jgi:hypothetical protein
MGIKNFLKETFSAAIDSAISLPQQIKQYYIQHGYEWDEINLFGVRNIDNPNSNRFDDLLCVVTDDFIRVFGGTTDPGTSWTPENRKKYSITQDVHLCLGYYKNVYQVGTHRGYRALVQSGNAVNWFVDKNKNGIVDADDKITKKAYGGINMHTVGNPEKLRVPVRSNVDFASAGCQVFANQEEFTEVMEMVLNSNKYKKNKKACFSYLLVAKEDFRFYNVLKQLKE